MLTFPQHDPVDHTDRSLLDVRGRGWLRPQVDLDDTSSCPIGAACEGTDCAERTDLTVATAQTTFGVHCLTLCGACAAERLPSLPLLEALTRAGRHADHLGLDVDAVAALLDNEKGVR